MKNLTKFSLLALFVLSTFVPTLSYAQVATTTPTNTHTQYIQALQSLITLLEQQVASLVAQMQTLSDNQSALNTQISTQNAQISAQLSQIVQNQVTPSIPAPVVVSTPAPVQMVFTKQPTPFPLVNQYGYYVYPGAENEEESPQTIPPFNAERETCNPPNPNSPAEYTYVNPTPTFIGTAVSALKFGQIYTCILEVTTANVANDGDWSAIPSYATAFSAPYSFTVPLQMDSNLISK